MVIFGTEIDILITEYGNYTDCCCAIGNYEPYFNGFCDCKVKKYD